MSNDHFSFIFAAYAIAVIVVATMIASLAMDHRALKRALAKLPARDAGDDAG